MTAPNDPNLSILTREDGRVVYHLGSSGDLSKDGDPKKPYHLPPYSAGALNFTLGHYWNSQATDRTACPIVIRKSPAQIVAANRMFPFGDTGCKVPDPPVYPPFKGPMDPAWITPYMPTTGERPDIGLITDASAFFMLGKTADGMISAAHAAGSFPMHYRDEKTGRPIDLLKYPKTNTNDMPGWGPPWLPRFPLNADGSANIGGGLHPQQAHYPEMSYVAYQATGDLGFLEDLQYSANYTTFCDAAKSYLAGVAIASGELRGLSWAFRNLFMAHAATLDAEAALAAAGKPWPTWLHPSSYYKKLLDNQLAYYSRYMADPTNQVFRLIAGPGMWGAWQNDFMLMATAFGVLTGHDEWAPIYLWALKNAIDRTSNKSGFPPGYGTPYYMDGAKPDWYSAFLAMSPPEAPPPTQDQIDKLKADPLNGGVMMGTLHEAMMTTRAVLVTALYLEKLGLADIRGMYPEIDICFANADRMCRNYGSMNARASIVLDASQAPTTIPPLPPVVPPTTPPISTGEITVSDIAFNAPFTATVTFKDNLGSPMVPDSVSWLAPDGFKLTADQTNKLAAHGVYGVAGASTIKATGTKAGISVTVTKEVAVPAAVPFLAAGEITLS